jgi:hypothetical protein
VDQAKGIGGSQQELIHGIFADGFAAAKQELIHVFPSALRSGMMAAKRRPRPKGRTS